MMASEYKKRGGGYTTDKSEQGPSQQHLNNWTDEQWQTKDGSGEAKNEDGSRQRYLPKEAWDKMTDKEKEETDAKKQKGSKEGQQYVSNTDKAKGARKEAENNGEDKRDGGENGNEDPEDEYVEDDEEVDDDDDDEEEEEEEEEDEDEEIEDAEEEDEANEDDGQESRKPKNAAKSAGQKRKHDTAENNANADGEDIEEDKEPSSPSKRQKNSPNGEKASDDKQKSSNDNSPGQQGSKDRLPKKGQTVHWKSLPGFVEGTVEEIACEEKEVDGKMVKASQDDPRIVLRSSKSGKIATHKPDAVYF